jgi:hypothetical protein
MKPELSLFAFALLVGYASKSSEITSTYGAPFKVAMFW